ncbi:hypothetical protein C7974DRAFT_386931 [Boeremia exigua]|uniref:uncharacterized protein n=1 Tax=Boeremia exigua TaxID=749465 RepID=UPI001E8E1844|nr:uncharacterized protein C7974DRAFT_386931 [Boeremia exigua]KAH6643160.1 hypothetical protein C7974DRAFT_386931 [Boeremia exigua]
MPHTFQQMGRPVCMPLIDWDTSTVSKNAGWVRRTAAVHNFSEVLNRIEVRKTAHEVGEILFVVSDTGRTEGRLQRVVRVKKWSD